MPGNSVEHSSRCSQVQVEQQEAGGGNYLETGHWKFDLDICKRKLDNLQHCLLLALLSCFHSSGKNKSDKDFQNSQSTVQKVKIKL